jgi:hypothetical protein
VVNLPEPPEFTKCVANKKKTAPKPAKGRPRHEGLRVRRAVQAGVRGPAQPGPELPHLRRVDRGGGRGPGHQGRRRGRQEEVRRHPQAVVPQGRRLQEVPASSGQSERTCSTASASTSSPTSCARRSSRARTRSPTPRSRPTTTRTSSASPSPSGATSASC